jgi:hypothetical protein
MSQFAVLAYNARRAKEHHAKMEFLDRQVAEIKKKKSVCTVFWGGWLNLSLTTIEGCWEVSEDL